MVVDDNGRWHVTKIVAGSRITDMMQFARYEINGLVDSFRKLVNNRVAAGGLTEEAANGLVQQYSQGANSGTYLE